MRKKNTVNTKEHKPQNNGKRETRHIHSTREANLWREEQNGMLSLMLKERKKKYFWPITMF